MPCAIGAHAGHADRHRGDGLQTGAKGIEMSETYALYLLGSGTPTPTRARFGTAYVLQIGQEFLLFDCGPATTHKLVGSGLWPTQIDYLFLTHHHFDHNVDLPCFLLCRWDQSTGTETVLKIFGPPPTGEIIQRLIGPNGAFTDDWKARVNAPLSQSVHANRGGASPAPSRSGKAGMWARGRYSRARDGE